MKRDPNLLRPVKKRRGRASLSPPAPEIIDGGDWQIKQSRSVRNAGVQRDLSGRGGRMVVPFGESEQARLVRAHELMHIHISPKEWPRPYSDQLMNLLEDGRVHRHLLTTGFDLSSLAEVIGDAELGPKQLTTMHPALLAGLVISTEYTGEYLRVVRALSTIGRDDIVQVAGQLHQHCYDTIPRPGVDKLGEIADLLVRAYGDPDDPESPEPEESEAPGTAVPLKSEERFDPSTTDWGRMDIKRVPLTRRLPGKLRGRRRILPDTRGRRLRRVGRLHVDGKVFGNRIPQKGGGAVLIDTSGSMELSQAQVEQIVQALPGGIVATYAGRDDQETGELRIVAENGRLCAPNDIQPRCQLNIIDGPALKWLAAQRGPHYWVSDGKVTGMNEKQSPLLVAEVNHICKQNRIRRVDNMETLLGT